MRFEGRNQEIIPRLRFFYGIGQGEWRMKRNTQLHGIMPVLLIVGKMAQKEAPIFLRMDVNVVGQFLSNYSQSGSLEVEPTEISVNFPVPGRNRTRIFFAS